MPIYALCLPLTMCRPNPDRLAMHIMKTRPTIRPALPLRQRGSPPQPTLLPALSSLAPLQSAPMNDLIVNNQLPPTIIDDKRSDGTIVLTEGTLNLAVQTTLVDDRQALLHITTISHADDTTIISHVQDAVLFVDGAEHALDDDRWLRVGDKAALFLKLTSEEVDAEVSVLAGLG